MHTKTPRQFVSSADLSKSERQLQVLLSRDAAILATHNDTILLRFSFPAGGTCSGTSWREATTQLLQSHGSACQVPRRARAPNPPTLQSWGAAALQAKTSYRLAPSQSLVFTCQSTMIQRALMLLMAVALGVASAMQSWPNGPFVTEGSSVLDASGNRVTYAGVNVGLCSSTLNLPGLHDSPT
jgi:hypothetical protein